VHETRTRELLEEGCSEVQVERPVDAIYLVVSFEGYDQLVKQLGRPIETVQAIWEDAIGKLLAA
jgi:hypothetical protein